MELHCFVIILIFTLHEAFGLGSDEFPAPQGQALASMIQGITGGEVPTVHLVRSGLDIRI